ncbi:MAG: haloacid dehalogenase type II [Burkholderiales bacterium]
MNQTQSSIEAVVFDAYGTLFNVHSVVALCEELFPGKGAQLSQLWRGKQLEYSWQRSLMQRYEDFWRITAAGLDYACDALKLECSGAQRERLMQAYLHLRPYAEVPDILRALKPMPLAILSNGSPAMLDALVRNAAMQDLFAHVISVDAVRCYKPDPRVYQLAADRLQLAKSSIAFVSANGWDIAGCAAFGFTPVWVNRSGQPRERLGVEPAAILSSLTDLPTYLAQKTAAGSGVK